MWAQLGNRGWSYDDVLPYFRRSEDRSSGADRFRATGGPQHVSDISERHPICEAFIAGAESLGVPLNPDYNGATQEGVAYYQRTIRNGRRHSAATGYLHPALSRPNLKLVTNAHVLRLDVEGRHVRGIAYRRGSDVRQATATAETVLAAGVVNSPHILQLSGIGSAERLSELGITPVHHLPGVGEGLQDHYATRVAHRVMLGKSLNERARGLRLLWEIGRWLTKGQGVLSLSPAHVAAFVRSRPELDVPDLQFVFTPASYSEGVTGRLQPFPGMTCGVWQMRPHSRGWVRAKSADPMVPPGIQPNYLAEETDQRAAIEGLVSVRAQPGAARAPGSRAGAFCRGLDVTLEFDARAWQSGGLYLLASVLDRFLALHATVNAFVRTSAVLRGRRRAPALSRVASLAILAGSALLRVSIMAAGDESARRPEISLRYAQPDNLPE